MKRLPDVQYHPTLYMISDYKLFAEYDLAFLVRMMHGSINQTLVRIAEQAYKAMDDPHVYDGDLIREQGLIRCVCLSDGPIATATVAYVFYQPCDSWPYVCYRLPNGSEDSTQLFASDYSA